MPKIHIKELVEGLYLLRIDDDRTKYFEASWYIPEGVTYNAYLLLSKGKKILFDGWKYTYNEEFLETVVKLVNPKEIDCIVVHHTEPDHSGTLFKLLELNGFKTEVWGHLLAARMLESFYGAKIKFRNVTDGEKLELGERKLRFIHTPWLHWPETIMTYIEEDNILFSGDAFGAYSLPNGLFDNEEKEISEYIPFARKYLATVIGHYREYVVKNIEKLKQEKLNIKILAPLHGLVWKNNPLMIMDNYLSWAKALPQEKKAVIIYSSMYGFVEKGISFVTEELTQAGYKPVIFRFTDTTYDHIADILGEAIDAQVIIIGAGVYEAGLFPYMRHVIDVLIEKLNSPKPVLILSSYGWGNVAKIKAEEAFQGTRFKIIDVIDFRGKPQDEIAKRIKNAIRAM